MTTALDYYDEVVQEATNTATYAAADILSEIINNKFTIEDMLHEDIVEAIHAVVPRNMENQIREDHYDEIMEELQTNFIQYLHDKL
jgi:hypothetical protein